MGKFNEYSQKATPADNDTLMIYDATSKANKLSPFSGIWNWIVGKLTNAVISNLQTNDKTVIGALNELNSNSLSDIKNVNWTTNEKRIEIDVSSFAPTKYHYGFLIYGWNRKNELLPFSFSTMSGDTFVSLKENSSVTATIENNKITFSLIDGTFWGGIRVLLFK